MVLSSLLHSERQSSILVMENVNSSVLECTEYHNDSAINVYYSFSVINEDPL
jgi:hypothetical protein